MPEQRKPDGYLLGCIPVYNIDMTQEPWYPPHTRWIPQKLEAWYGHPLHAGTLRMDKLRTKRIPPGWTLQEVLRASIPLERRAKHCDPEE